MSSPLKTKLAHLRDRIARAARASQRNPEDIRLVAVGKTQPVERIQEAIRAGCTIIGENYIQEARDKFDALAAHNPCEWHFIGHLQRNKAKYAVRMFDLIQTVDSLKLAQALQKECLKIGKRQRILIQVNIAGEETKSGAGAAETMDLVRQVASLEQLQIEGLMTIPPLYNDPQGVRPYFSALRDLRDQISGLRMPNVEMQTLSMGMTGDFEVAIAEGATLVRIGTALFGPRQ